MKMIEWIMAGELLSEVLAFFHFLVSKDTLFLSLMLSNGFLYLSLCPIYLGGMK